MRGVKTETLTANHLSFHLELNAAHKREAVVEVWRCKTRYTMETPTPVRTPRETIPSKHLQTAVIEILFGSILTTPLRISW